MNPSSIATTIPPAWHTPELVSLFRLTRALDEFTAAAWDIPLEYRHAKHQQGLEVCAGLVIWLDTKAEPIPICRSTIAKVLPAYIYLLGRSTWPGFGPRKMELDRITKAFNSL